MLNKLKLLGKLLVSLFCLFLISINSYNVYYYFKPAPLNLVIPQSKLIDIKGTIATQYYASLYDIAEVADMPAKTKQLLKMVRRGSNHIYIRIESGGGLVDVGSEFISVMNAAQQQGVHFTCIVDDYAMSMALIIFSECDTRYAVFGSRLMWHSISTSGRFTLNQFKTSELLSFMLAKNEEMWASTRIHFYPWYFVEHFKNETIIRASELEREGIGYLRVINDITVVKNKKLKTEKANVKKEK